MAYGKIEITNERRPCYVNGKRAMFHRWADNARPVKPRGMENDENADVYQLHTVHALVEYEDGTMERVWPSSIQFADGGDFDQIYFQPKSEREQITKKDCMKCAHHDEYIGKCLEECTAAINCNQCENPCQCRDCRNLERWAPVEGNT